MMDRARYLRESGYEQAARDLFARSHNFTHKPADPDRFLDMMVLLSKAAAGDRQWQTAYDISPARSMTSSLPVPTSASRAMTSATNIRR